MLFLILMLIGHIMACCWYMVSDVEQRKDNVLVDGWVKREGWGPTCEDLACWDGPGTCDAGDEGLTWQDLGTPCVPRATKYTASFVYSLTDFVAEISFTEVNYRNICSIIAS